jgi:hypothetical protein
MSASKSARPAREHLRSRSEIDIDVGRAPLQLCRSAGDSGKQSISVVFYCLSPFAGFLFDMIQDGKC